MKVKVVERQPTRVAYLRHVGPYGRPISQFWRAEVAPWIEASDLLGRARYGVSHDDPAITAPEKCRYDACVEVSKEFVATGDALTTALPGGQYAATHFRGTDAEISQTWNTLLREWLPSSGLQLDPRPCFEYYAPGSPHDDAATSGVFECDILVAVMPL